MIKILLALAATAAIAHADCPKPVSDAIAKKFPKSTISSCRAEKEHGRDQFEVRVAKPDGAKAEVDVAPDGKILQVEEAIALDKVPAAVTKAFAAKYPKAKAARAEKQTSEGAVTYELAFDAGAEHKEVTFDQSGKFVEEE